ncbi:MAG: acyltransferase [Edaphobacter sp.]
MAHAVAELKARERDPHSSDSSLRYVPGLDMARGLAILMVLCYHGMADAVHVDTALNKNLFHALSIGFGLGLYGVHLFFVLSGFLISGILIDNRSSAGYYRTFYLRRAARILPAGLLMLVALKAGSWISWKFFFAALFYAANMPRLFGTIAEYGPLWSLAVEEQFYLVWPFVVKRCTRSALILVCSGIVLLTPVLRFALLGQSANWDSVQHKTWAVCDFFAAGALIAIAVRTPGYSALLGRIFPWLIGVGGLLVLASNLLPEPQNRVALRFWFAGWLEPWVLLCSGLVLLTFLRPSIATGLLAPAFLFLAKISYGLYLCHQLIFQIVARHWVIPVDGSFGSLGLLLLRFAVAAALAIGVAALSRWTVEEFFLRLKPKPVHGIA